MDVPAYIAELTAVAAPASVPEQQAADFAALVKSQQARVFRSLRYLGVLEADLADASQEVFLVVHRRLAEFRGESKLETWLYGICLGIARNARRSQRRRGTEPVDDDAGCAALQEVELEQRQLRHQLHAALARLAPEQREVFVLHEIEELEIRAVADAVGCPLFTAYSRLRLARKHLGRWLACHGSEVDDVR
jgi:RNA polymerase sigma-70 factor (ECF subfamily)